LSETHLELEANCFQKAPLQGMFEGAVAVEKVLTDYSPCLKITESVEKK
jgi:hypothetical protein